jgi:hypothetical protein
MKSLNHFNNRAGFVSDFSVGRVIKQMIAKLEGSAARAKVCLQNIVASVGAATTASCLKNGSKNIVIYDPVCCFFAKDKS